MTQAETLPTLAEQIEALAGKSSNSQVVAMLLHAAQLEATAPVWKVGRVRIKKRDCPDCKDGGVIFKGQHRITETTPLD